MNFVVGALIIGRLAKESYFAPMSEEEFSKSQLDVFRFMISLLDKSSKLVMSGLWQDKIPKMKLRVFQLDRLLVRIFDYIILFING